jgi:osmotically-inducible protein OsmY
MRTDSQIKRDIEGQLQWSRDFDATDIGVSVKDGVVTLTGVVRSSIEKLLAEREAKRVDGIVGVANDIDVRVPYVDHRPDAEIARHVVAALQADLPFSSQSVKTTVKRQRVILEGRLEWPYQRSRAELAALRVRGIKGCTNSIKLEPRVEINAIDEKIDDALKARATESLFEEVDANRELVPRGTVRSWAQR